jgi:hypothetical protein
MHMKIFVKFTLWERKEKNLATAQIGTKIRAHVFNAGLLARCQFASGRSFARPT